jgi:hypothetical protein
VQRACRTIIEPGDPNYFILSIAAKADFILGRRASGAMAREEIIREAEKFDWHIQASDLDNAVGFLERVGLLQAAHERAS